MLSWLEQFRERGLVRRGPDGRWETVADATRARPVPVRATEPQRGDEGQATSRMTSTLPRVALE